MQRYMFGFGSRYIMFKKTMYHRIHSSHDRISFGAEIQILLERIGFPLLIVVRFQQIIHMHVIPTVYQGPRWIRIMKKNKSRKSGDTLPLSQCANGIAPNVFSDKATASHFIA